MWNWNIPPMKNKKNMTTENFCYWLRGFQEIGGSVPNEQEWKTIRDHLDLVFKKETPNRIKIPNSFSPHGTPILC